MDVKAILLVGGDADSEASPSPLFNGVPPALLDVLGRPVAMRVIDRLRRNGISGACILGEDGMETARWMKRCAAPGVRLQQAASDQVWRAAETAFSDAVQAGAELLLVVRLGCYAELDYDALLQFHLDQRNRVTAVCRSDGQCLDTFVISASRRNDAAYLFRHHFTALRTPSTNFIYDGYINPLREARDLRCLAVDGLLLRNQVVPAGLEVRPGVWIASGARIQNGARILAPAFIGERVKLRPAAVITRCSAIEHHSEVDCGSVVEDSTILPYSYVGAGLDVAHAVVGWKHLAHLRRNVEVDIADSKLLGMNPSSAPWRAVVSAASLASFLPVQAIRGLFGCPKSNPTLPAAVQAPSEALKSPGALPATDGSDSNRFPDLVVARRYGNE